jgi:hypothetical protein
MEMRRKVSAGVRRWSTVLPNDDGPQVKKRSGSGT